MKMHDDLKHRLAREADGLRFREAPVDRLASRGRSRRTRHRVVGAAGAAVLIAGVVVPLWLLLGIGGGPNAKPTESLRPAAGEQTSPGQEPAVSAEHLVGSMQCLDGLPSASSYIYVVAPGQDPLKTCADAWSQGSMPASGGAVPSLVACVKNMSVIVVPGEGATFCSDHGWADLPPDFSDVLGRWNKVMDELRVTQPNACYDVATLTARIRGALDRNGFSDWGIVDSWHENSPNGTCAAQGFNYHDLNATIVNDTVS